MWTSSGYLSRVVWFECYYHVRYIGWTDSSIILVYEVRFTNLEPAVFEFFCEKLLLVMDFVGNFTKYSVCYKVCEDYYDLTNWWNVLCVGYKVPQYSKLSKSISAFNYYRTDLIIIIMLIIVILFQVFALLVVIGLLVGLVMLLIINYV